MVEVFKTNVKQVKKANMLIQKLVEHFPALKINFDLKDCDKILRVEGINISTEDIVEILASNNFQCVVLE